MYKQAIVHAFQNLSTPPHNGCTAQEVKSFLQSLPQFANFESSRFLRVFKEGVESGALVKADRGGYVLDQAWRDKGWVDDDDERRDSVTDSAPLHHQYLNPGAQQQALYHQRMIQYAQNFVMPNYTTAIQNFANPCSQQQHNLNMIRNAQQQQHHHHHQQQQQQRFFPPSMPQPPPRAKPRAPVHPPQGENEQNRMIQLAVRLEGDLNNIINADGTERSDEVPNSSSGSGSAGGENTASNQVDLTELSDSPTTNSNKRPAQISASQSSKRPKFSTTLPLGGRVLNSTQPGPRRTSIEEESWIQAVVDASRANVDGEGEDGNSLAGTFVKGMLKVDQTVLNQAFRSPTIKRCIANTIAPGLGLPSHLCESQNWEGYVKVSYDSIAKFAREVISQMTRGVRSALKVAFKEMSENHVSMLAKEREKWEKEKQEGASSNSTSQNIAPGSTVQLQRRIAQLEKQLALESQKRTTQLSEMESIHLRYSEEYEREHLEFVTSLQTNHQLMVDALKNEIEEMKRTHNEIIETYLDASVETVRAILESERQRV